MGRETKTSPFPRIASRETVNSFDPHKGQIYGISLTRFPDDLEDLFRVDIEAPTKSPWNKSCAKVFARSFLRKHLRFQQLYGENASSKVEAAFGVHLDYLRKVYKQQQKAKVEQDAIDMHRRRTSRLRDVSINLIHRAEL